MNSKGSFSAIVGVALVVLLAAVGTVYYSTGASQKALLEQQDALEVRQHWTNVRYLLDKAAAKALYDVGGTSCKTNSVEYKIKLEEYFPPVLTDTNKTIACEFTNITVNFIRAKYEAYGIEFTLSCSKPGSVSYSQTVVRLKKELRKLRTPPFCIVWDTPGDYQEIP